MTLGLFLQIPFLGSRARDVAGQGVGIMMELSRFTLASFCIPGFLAGPSESVALCGRWNPGSKSMARLASFFQIVFCWSARQSCGGRRRAGSARGKIVQVNIGFVLHFWVLGGCGDIGRHVEGELGVTRGAECKDVF